MKKKRNKIDYQKAYSSETLFYLATAAFLFGIAFIFSQILFAKATAKSNLNQRASSTYNYILSASALGSNQVKFNWTPVALAGTQLVVKEAKAKVLGQKTLINASVDGMTTYIWVNGNFGKIYTAALWRNKLISDPIVVSTNQLSSIPFPIPTPF